MNEENNTEKLFNEFLIKFTEKKSFFSDNQVFTEDLIKKVHEIYILNGLGEDELKNEEISKKWINDKEYQYFKKNKQYFELKLHIQFKERSEIIKELLSNIIWFYHLGPQISNKLKSNQIKKWLNTTLRS